MSFSNWTHLTLILFTYHISSRSSITRCSCSKTWHKDLQHTTSGRDTDGLSTDSSRPWHVQVWRYRCSRSMTLAYSLIISILQQASSLRYLWAVRRLLRVPTLTACESITPTTDRLAFLCIHLHRLRDWSSAMLSFSPRQHLAGFLRYS